VDDDDTVVDDDDTVVDDDDTVVDDDDTVVDDDDATPEVCSEDSYEDNDSQGSPSAVTPGTFTGLRVCPTDEDWFQVLVLSGETITATATFDHAEGDIDLYLFDASATELDYSMSSADTETVTYDVTSPNNYYVQVELFSDTGIDLGNDYDLEIDVSSTSGCTIDFAEPNDTLAEAFPVGDITLTGLSACPTDSDFFEVNLDSGGLLDVDLTFTDADGDIDVYILDDVGTTLASAISTDDDEAVDWTAAYDGYHYIEVALVIDDAVPGNDYELEVAGTSTSCVADFAEPNDSDAAPYTISAGATLGLNACATDEDWFSFTAGAGDTIDLNVFFVDAEGDIDIALYDPSATWLASAASSDDDEVLTWSATVGGDYLLMVELFLDDGAVPGNEYGIDLAVGSTSTCTVDSYEPNDTQATAYALLGPSFTGIHACETDSDWFEIEVGGNEETTVEVFFSDAEGDIDAFLYDAAGGLLGSSISTTDDEELFHSSTASGSIFVEVVLTFDDGSVTGNPYTIDIDKVPICGPDAYDPNDDEYNAATVTLPMSETELTLCDPTDEDWFELPGLVITDVIEADMVYDPAAGDVDMFLWDPTGTMIASSTATSGVESIFQYVATGGDWLLQVVLVVDTPPDGAFYNLDVQTSTAPSTCVADALEPNDSQGAAAMILPVTEQNLTACPTDSDWYLFPAVTGDSIEFDLVFAHAEGDIDVDLYDPSGALVASSFTTTDDESITWPATADGDYTVEVYLLTDSGGIPGNYYDMTLAGITASCSDDTYEPNDDSAAATTLPNGIYQNLTVCTDADWFEVTALAFETLTVDVDFEHAEGDVDAWLWDDTVSSVLVSGITTTDDEQLVWVSPDVATYYVEVSLTADTGGIPGNIYDIEVNTVNTFACSPDAYEPNDDISTPSPLPTGLTTNLTVCESEPDYYSFSAFSGYAIDVEVDFATAEGDIDIALYDPSGAEIADSSTTSAPETLSLNAPVDGDYVLLVEMYADAGPDVGAEYSLDLDVTAGACPPDSLEPNDSALQAVPINAGYQGGFTACYDVEDWYSIEVDAGQALAVEAFFSHDEGDLDLALYDSVGSLITNSLSTDDDEDVSWLMGVTGPVFIVVNLVLDDGPNPGNRYDLNVEIIEGTCVADAMEPNDTSGAAPTVGPPGMPDLTACPTDADWFAIDLASGDELDLRAVFTDLQGDIDIWLYDAALTELASSTGVVDNEQILYTATATATYYVEVDLVVDAGPTPGNSYFLMALGPAAGFCPPDGYEPNETQGEATMIGAGQLDPMFLCTGDVDWYGFLAFAGETIDIDLLFGDDEGDIDIALYDSTGGWLDSSATSDDDEDIDYSVTTTDYYYLEVELYSDAGGSPGNWYDLVLGF